MNSLSVALRAGYLSVRTAEGASEKQSSLKACLRNGLTYLFTYLLHYLLHVSVVKMVSEVSVCSLILAIWQLEQHILQQFLKIPQQEFHGMRQTYTD